MVYNYHNGKIYKIISNLTDMIYVGSCINTLTKRLNRHKSKDNSCSSKMIIELGEYSIVLVEQYKCENKMELVKREQYWIDYFKDNGYNVINKNSAYITEEQRKENDKKWNREHKEEIKEYNKIYKEEHKTERREYSKEYYSINKTERSEYSKKRYKENKELIKKRKQLYIDNNKEMISLRNKENYFMNKFSGVMSEFILSIECY
tara:strand:- start:225 stop:839 length:615 start_codon:yes stop_codon:yes gene_type:complete